MGAAENDYSFAPDECEVVYCLTTESRKTFVRRGDISGLLMMPLFLHGVKEWRRYKRFGLPHGKGWVYERPKYVKVIEIFEQEYDLYQSEEMKKNARR